MPFSDLFNDPKISDNLDLDHAKIDNYQIYSIATFTAKELIKYTTYTTSTGEFIPPVPPPTGIFTGHGGQYLETVNMLGFIPYVFIYSPEPFIISEIDPNNPSIIKKHTFTKHYGFVLPDIEASQPALNNNNLGDWESPKCITFQSFSPVKKIEFDMVALLKSYPLKQSRYKIFHRANMSGIERFIANYETRNEPWAIHLATGYNLDNRIKLNKLTGIATSDRVIEYSYYAHNPLETHPKVYVSLDWYHRKINVKKGRPYEIKIDNIMLGTLELDNQTKAEILSTPDTPGRYPKQYLFGENLSALFDYWRSLMPPVNDNLNDVGNIQFGRYLQTGGIYIDEEFNFIDNDVRVSAANNDLWDKGAVTEDYRKPLSTHPIYENIDEFSLFEALQLDGSYGDLTMDSPRILEIHAALDAGKWAVNDIDSNQTRVNNLGWQINRLCEINGIRVNANGQIDLQRERNEYLPATLNNPTLASGNYGIGHWGKKGMIIPHIVRSYNKDGKEEKLYDVVHDNQQLLMAVYGQLNRALDLQNSGEIRLYGLDGKVQSYPNKLAYDLAIGHQVQAIKYSADKALNLALVTGNEVRELFSGIGIPITQKSLKLVDSSTKKSIELPYIGYQKNKPSVTNNLTTLAINIAVILGVLMPKKGTVISNPFNKFGSSNGSSKKTG
jgi:hypothetical protein